MNLQYITGIVLVVLNDGKTIRQQAYGMAERKAKRQQSIQELLTALPIHPVTLPVAVRVGHKLPVILLRME